MTTNNTADCTLAAVVVFDGSSADFRAQWRVALAAANLRARKAVAARKGCAWLAVTVSVGGEEGRRVASVRWPGGSWVSRPCRDDMTALVAAQIGA